jgi:hypothetical protein
MKTTHQLHAEDGQTIIALLIFMMLVIMLTTAAATITITNIRGNNALLSSQQALLHAESGAEDALKHLTTDPTYTGGTLSLPNGTVTMNISGTTTKTIVATGQAGNSSRSVTVVADYTENTPTVTSWTETP